MKKIFTKTLALVAMLTASLSISAQYCDYPLGHLNNPEFGDKDGRILLSLEPTGNTNEYKVTIKTNGGTRKLDYIYIELGNGATTSPYPITAGTDDNGDAFDEMSATFTYTGTTGSMGSIQWSHPDWNGRWGCSLADIDFTSLTSCAAAAEKTISDLTLTSEASLFLVTGDVSTITTTTTSTGAITYTTSDPAVATVDNEGEITAVAMGEATITVKQAEDATYQAGSVKVKVSVSGPRKASGKGYGSMLLKNVSLYDWNGDFAGTTACGAIDLAIVTYGDKLIYKAVVKDGTFEDCTNYFCQLRTWKTDLTEIREHWALKCSDDKSTRTLLPTQTNNSPSLSIYGDEIKLTSYMVLTGCGARTMKTVSYKRDYINNYDSSDETAPVLGAATVTPGEDDITISFDAVTSEDVFYLIEDVEFGKKFISLEPSFTIAKDGSGLTYHYSCYAVDFNGNMSEAQEAEVKMPFSVLSNLALNRKVYSGQHATNQGPEKAVDGVIENSRWSAGAVESPENAWWAIDLGAVYNLTSLEMAWEGAYSKDFVILGADEKPATWNDVTKYETTLVSNEDVVPVIADNKNDNTKNNVYEVSGHARYLLFMPSSLANNAWGASFYEFRAFGTGIYDPNAGIDTENPVINGATASSITHNSAVIQLDATDNVGIIKVSVVDEANEINIVLIPSEENTLTLSGLSEATTYTLTLVAYDAANLESNVFTMEAFTTKVDPTIPQVAAPAPKQKAENVRPIYSDAYTSILEHSFALSNWGSVAGVEKAIDDNHYLLYDMTAGNAVIWGENNAGGNAIVAKAGYNAGGTEDNTGVDASAMDSLHMDIFSLVAMSNIEVRINDNLVRKISLTNEGWQQIDIALADPVEALNTTSVRWFKITNIVDANRQKLAFDNIFFYKKDSTTPTAIDNTVEAVKAVKMIENGQLIIIKNGIRYNVAGQMVK